MEYGYFLSLSDQNQCINQLRGNSITKSQDVQYRSQGSSEEGGVDLFTGTVKRAEMCGQAVWRPFLFFLTSVCRAF